jgi:hypothetical protein
MSTIRWFEATLEAHPVTEIDQVDENLRRQLGVEDREVRAKGFALPGEVLKRRAEKDPNDAHRRGVSRGWAGGNTLRFRAGGTGSEGGGMRGRRMRILAALR